MNIAPYVDVAFGDGEAMSQFKFIHFVTHDTISQAIEDAGINIDNYPLDNWDNLPDFMFQHNIIHIRIAQALGLSAPQDLELYDLEEESQFYDWMAIHGQEHDRILLALGF